MENSDFFRLEQEQWYSDFVDQEVNAIRESTIPHDEFFEFDDVPF
jgi:hypothetical protein